MIYTSLVQSVVLYGSETWTMRKVDSDRIQSFHMQTLRRILVRCGGRYDPQLVKRSSE